MQALAAHLRDDARMAVLQLGEALLQQQRHCARHARGSPAPARRRARHCRPPWRADCRRRWCRGCRRSCPSPPRSVARQAPIGKPPPMPLAIAMMSGVMPDHSWAKSLPVRPMPLWTSSKISSRPCSSQSSRRPRRNCGRHGADAALALDRLDQDRGRLRRRSPPSAPRWSPKGTWSKPSTLGPKPSRYFCLAAGGDGRQRAAVEGALEGDDAEALGMAVRRRGTCAPS